MPLRVSRGTFRRAARDARLLDAAWAALAGAALAVFLRVVLWAVTWLT